MTLGRCTMQITFTCVTVHVWNCDCLVQSAAFSHFVVSVDRMHYVTSKPQLHMQLLVVRCAVVCITL